MRILIYSHAFAPNVGGVETCVMLLARGLARAGFQVTLITLTPAGGMNDRDLPFRVYRRPSLPALTSLIWRAELLHLAGPCFLPMLLGLVMRRPMVVEHHGYQAVCPNGRLLFEPAQSICPGHYMRRRYHHCLRCNAGTRSWIGSLFSLLLTFPRRWACRHLARNIAVSFHVKNRICLPNSTVILHGVPDVQGNAAITPGSQPASTTFTYVGRLVSEKGLTLLVDAASRLQSDGYDFRLKFIGDGPERARLERAVGAAGLREQVKFTGYLRGDSLRLALSDATALVMPSIWEETAGLSAIEHMMRGRVVIATDIGGLGEMVSDAALKFAVRDQEGLTSCMKRVLDQHGFVQELGQKARQRAQQLFRDERMVAEHIVVYREALKDRRPSPVRTGGED